MFVECYLREGTVYVPTVVRQASSPIYNVIEPIAAVPSTIPMPFERHYWIR